MKNKRIIVAVIILIVFTVILSACNQVPKEFREWRFYGTYDKLIEDYCEVLFSHFDEELGGRVGKVWKIKSIDGSKFVYLDSYNNDVEGTADVALLNTASELISRIGASVTVKKKRIILHDSNTTLQYNKTHYSDIMKWLYFYSNSDNIATGLYKDIDQENNVLVLAVSQLKSVVTESGEKYEVIVTKHFRK